MLTRKDIEFAGPYGRAIIRLGGGFHSLVWMDGQGGVAAKLYPSRERNSEASAVADALKCVHRNIAPPPGARSMRRITRRGMQPVSAGAVEELRAIEQSPTWWPLTKPAS